MKTASLCKPSNFTKKHPYLCKDNMDTNRNSLETILKLPTHRLLNVYRKEVARGWYEDYSDEHKARVTAMKQELNRREHVRKR